MPRLKTSERELLRCQECGRIAGVKVCSNCAKDRDDFVGSIEDPGDGQDRYDAIKPEDFGIEAGEVL